MFKLYCMDFETNVHITEHETEFEALTIALDQMEWSAVVPMYILRPDGTQLSDPGFRATVYELAMELEGH